MMVGSCQGLLLRDRCQLLNSRGRDILKKSCKKLKILKGLYSTSSKSTDHAWVIVADLLTGKANKSMNVKKSSKNAHIKYV